MAVAVTARPRVTSGTVVAAGETKSALYALREAFVFLGFAKDISTGCTKRHISFHPNNKYKSA